MAAHIDNKPMPTFQRNKYFGGGLHLVITYPLIKRPTVMPRMVIGPVRILPLAELVLNCTSMTRPMNVMKPDEPRI